MKKMKTKNKCLVTSLAIIAMLMMSLGVKAQNVTIGPDNGNIITGVAGGNTADSGTGRGMGSMWRHEQLALMVTTSDIANLTSGGELADPSCAIDKFEFTHNENGQIITEPKRLIIGAGQTQTFMVVSLPKGYRITGYRLVLQPNIYGTIRLHPENPANTTGKSWEIGEDDTMCFYETKPWSEGSPYGGNTHSNQLTCEPHLAVATCEADGSTRMQNNNSTNRSKEYVIERTSMSPDDMSNQLYFFFASSGNNRNTPYQYAVSIISFELRFTAQGTFEAEVTPSSSSTEAVSLVESPFSTSKIDIGKLEPQQAHDNATPPNYFTVYGYNYANVRDLIAYNYLYEENAVANGAPSASAGNKTIYPVVVDGKGAYAFGNGTYYVEPPVSIQYGTGQNVKEAPIGFRVVGAEFSCEWGTKSPAKDVPIPDVCKISVSYDGTNYLNDNLDFVQTNSDNAFQWQVDEYGNLYTGDPYRHYLSCFGTGATRILSLGSSATGNDAKHNLKILDGDPKRIVYHSSKEEEAEQITVHIGSTTQEDLRLYDLDGNRRIDDADVALATGQDYYLYYIRIQEGNDYHLRGYVSRDPDNYNNNRATATTVGSHNISQPSFYPGEYELIIYNEKGVEKTRISVDENTAGTAATKYTLTGLNNDALKFGIEGLTGNEIVETENGVEKRYTCDQALVRITLMLEALNPYIDKMDIVCNDIPEDPEQEEPNLEITQTFTSDDFSVSGGKFIFYVPEDYSREPLLFSFKNLYSKYGDETYYNDDETLQKKGNGRYSFVTSDYFKKVSGNKRTKQQLMDLGMSEAEALEWPVNNGLYDTPNYQPNIGSNGPEAGKDNFYPYTMKVNTSTAGTVRFRFNNADQLEGNHTGEAVLEEYPFSVDTYLNNYPNPDAATPATAEFKQCKLNANPGLNQHSGIYYVFTADETRYNIAPTTAWQHRYYAFYRMDIELRAKTFKPNLSWTKIYDQTFYTDKNGNTKEDSMWGLKLDVADTENGQKVQGYLTYQEIIDNVLGREGVYFKDQDECDAFNAKLPGAVAAGASVPADYQTRVGSPAAGSTLTDAEAKAYNAKLEGSVTTADWKIEPIETILSTTTNPKNAPESMAQILYVDGTPLYAMLNSSQNSVVKKLEDLKALLPANSLVILPENTKSLLNNVAFETTGESQTRSFSAGKDIVLTDKQPFFSPYKIQVDAANKAIYRREQSGPNTFKLVDHATVVLPFTLSVSGGKHTNRDDKGNLTDDGFAFNLRTLKKLRTPVNNNYYEGDGYFDLYTKDEENKDVTQTKANQPYMVEVVQGESDDYSFIATQYGAVIEPTPSVTDEGKGIGVKNFESVIEKNLPNAAHLTSYGTYSGSKIPIGNAIYYFNKDRFYCSTILRGKYTEVNVRPFRAYYATAGSVSATAKMTGFTILYDLFSDDGGITTSLTETSKPKVMTISTDKGSMMISANEDIQVKIMNVNGVNVNAFQMNAGEQRQVNVPSGIYIVNNTKILVK
jgi:hypothetical protein